MCYIQVKVNCLHCESPKVKKNGKKASGTQNFMCNDCKKQFQFEYKYRGADPRVKCQIPKMAMHASGIRDTAKVLGISAVTVILTLRIWFRSILEPNFAGTYEHVIIECPGSNIY